MRLILTGNILFLLATLGWTSEFREDFNDGNANGWRTFTGRALHPATGNIFPVDQSTQWFVEDGELVSISEDVCIWGSVFGIGEPAWTDYEFEFEFKIQDIFPAGCGATLSGSLVGFGVRFDNPDESTINGLNVIAIARGGVFNLPICERFFDGDYTSIASVGGISFATGQWHTAKAVVKDNRYEMFINNQRLCDFEHELPAGGSAVFMGKNCEVHFDNVKITGDAIPGTVTSVSLQSKLATAWGEIKTRN